jgi:hypothetical protein
MGVSIEELKQRLKVADKQIEDLVYRTKKRMANWKKRQAKGAASSKGKERPASVKEAISETSTGQKKSGVTRANMRKGQKKRRERERAKKAPD